MRTSRTVVKVFIARAVEEHHLARIRELSPRLEVVFKPCRRLADMTPYLAEIEILHTHDASFDPALAPRLKWIQLTGAGVDYLKYQPIMNSEVVITNARVFAIPIAEYVFGLILSFCRKFPNMMSQFQRQREWPDSSWNTCVGRELSGSVLGVVGYGEIGKALGRIGRCFGMRVMATRRTINQPYEQDGVQILPAHQLTHLLALSDFVVICVPLTTQTERLIGKDELKVMKPSAYLINISRGKVVEEKALIAALQQGGIAGAGLDVFAEEPLPGNSELFSLSNVILTPHIAGVTDRYEERMMDLFCENLERYLNGESLINVVDKKIGY